MRRCRQEFCLKNCVGEWIVKAKTAKLLLLCIIVLKTINKGAVMFKKTLSVFGVLVIGISGLLVFCNNDNPVATQSDINGSWTGFTAIRNSGAGQPDTFSCVLKINSSGTFSLLRGRIFYGSSGTNRDSSREAGTWTKIGTDSLVLSPHTNADSTKDSCFHYDGSLGQWFRCDGSLAAQFLTCPDPMRIKINITGSSWTVTLARYDDKTSIDFVLKKQ